MIAELNGVRLGYSDAGSGSPVALLVHGYLLNRSMWDPQLGPLRARGRVIAPDLRGFGASEPGPPGPLTMDQHADDLAALLDHLQVREPVVFCGLSMGGYIAFAFCQRHAQRLRALVLADTRATADTPEQRAERHALAEATERTASTEPAIQAYLPRLFSPTLPAGSPLVPIVRAMLGGTSLRGIADGTRGMAARPDSLDLLPQIGAPTLIMVGEHDVLTTRAEAELMHARLPHAQLVVISQAGHMSNMENPDEFNSALTGFLRACATGGRRAR